MKVGDRFLFSVPSDISSECVGCEDSERDKVYTIVARHGDLQLQRVDRKGNKHVWNTWYGEYQEGEHIEMEIFKNLIDSEPCVPYFIPLNHEENKA